MPRPKSQVASSSAAVRPRKARTPKSATPTTKARTGRKPNADVGAADAEFVDALTVDFRKFGASAIAQVREKDPVTYMKLCASVLPKSVIEDFDPLDTLSDEELRQRATDLAAKVGLGSASGPDRAGKSTRQK